MSGKHILKSFGMAFFVVAVYWVYGQLFGRANAVVGMMIGMATCALIKLNLTMYIRYKWLALTVLAVFLGVMSYLATLNPWLGLVINSFTFFGVCFIYVSDFQSLISYLFLLTYVFMWGAPIKSEQLGMRLLALIAGVMIIFIAQSLFNRNRFKKTSKERLLKALVAIDAQIEQVMHASYTYKDYMGIKENLYEVMGGLSGQMSFTYSMEEKYYFYIWLNVEKLTQAINTIHGKEAVHYGNYLKDLRQQLQLIKRWLEGTLDKEEALRALENLNSQYQDTPYEEIREGYEVIDYFMRHLESLSKKSKKRSMIGTIKGALETIKINLSPALLSKESLRISYAMRVALTVSICMWVVSTFQVPFGKWVVVTAYIVMQPYKEQSRTKAKKRLQGTILGTCAYVLINSIVPYDIPLNLFLLLVFTGYYYVQQYQYKAFFTAMLGLCIALGTEKLLIISIDRILFATIGILVALLINFFIMPYSMKDALKELFGKYSYLIDVLAEQLEKCAPKEAYTEEMIQRGVHIMSLENELMKHARKMNDEALAYAVYNKSLTFSLLGLKVLDYEMEDIQALRDKI